MAGAHLVVVLSIRGVPDMVDLVLDGPVSAHEVGDVAVCDQIKVGHFSIKSRPLQRPNSGHFSRRYGPVKPQGSWPLMITPEDKTNHHTPQRSTPVEPLKEINSPGGERKRDMGPSCFTINS